MIVVADTSAISNLLTIGRAWILQELFGTVIVPPAVEEELLAWHRELPSFVAVQAVEGAVVPPAISDGLDRGEIEAITLALELDAELLLMEERLGRTEALRLGLRVTGLLGVLLEAKRTGLIERLLPLLNELISKADFRVSTTVRSEVLRLAGERE